MDKVKTINKIKTEIIHHFYCDSCNKYLGSSEELDDGYYDELGLFHEEYYIDNDWYVINKNFCEKCKTDYLHKIKSNLCNLGFVRE